VLSSVVLDNPARPVVNELHATLGEGVFGEAVHFGNGVLSVTPETVKLKPTDSYPHQNK